MRILIAALVPVILAACSGAPGDAGSSDSAAQPASAGAAADTSRVTVEGVSFPAAMAEAPPEIVEAYVFAAKHPEVLKHMPCYCGCHEGPDPHGSNYDCFVDAIDGSSLVPRVDPDPMGFT